ncbi:integrase [Gossypium australe]|uniref:Integrase n=1 Tax=Gossypium australe TaxID=47621 RepID=A0A5B6VMU8_9ROSI|nr:integrase [Gossypium australe]
MLLQMHLSWKSLFSWRALNAYLTLEGDDSILAKLRARLLFLQRIHELQDDDPKLLCVPNNLELKQDILSKAHSSTYSIHPGSTKMFNDLKQMYWWLGMKHEISNFVTKCLVKAEHQDYYNLSQFLSGNGSELRWILYRDNL